MVIYIVIVLDYTPVCANHSFIIVLIAQEFLNDEMTESVSDILTRWVLTVWYCVVWHYRRSHFCLSRKFECPLCKRDHSEVESSSRIDSIFADTEVCVPSSFTGTTSGPVLHHAVH